MQMQISNRRSRISAVAVATLLLLGLVSAKDEPAPARTKQRLREGTRLVDVLGKFEASGERYSFVPKDPAEAIRVLENLALERIARVPATSQGSPQWLVSGTITEYNNQNFLLVTKAVQAGESSPELAKPAISSKP